MSNADRSYATSIFEIPCSLFDILSSFDYLSASNKLKHGHNRFLLSSCYGIILHLTG